MGYSSEAVFIRKKLTDEIVKKVLDNIAEDGFVLCEDKVEFGDIDSRAPHGIYLGQMNDSFYIIRGIYDSSGGFDSALGRLDLESLCLDLFPEEEILYINNHETANAYAYHLIRESQTIRHKRGFDPDVVIDSGNELDVEKTCYVKKEQRDGQWIYFTKSWRRLGEFDEWTHDQIGGSIAFQLVRHMTGGLRFMDDTGGFFASRYLPKGHLP